MNESSLIRSLLTLDNPFNTTEEVLAWIQQRNREVEVKVEPVPFAELKGWHFDEVTGDLGHDSGKFFSICGLDVYTNQSAPIRWQQAINVFVRRYFYPSVNTYKTICPDAAACPHSENIANRILCLPLYCTLPEEAIRTVAETVVDMV